MIEYINSFYSLYIGMAFYMMLGLVMVAMIKIFVSPQMIMKYIGGNNLKSIVVASAIGVPLPLCSCGVLPTAIEIRKSGANIGASTAFLISTPQTGVNNIIATYGMMGIFMAIYRPIAAFVSGIIGGLITGFFDKNNKKLIKTEETAHSCCSHNEVVKAETCCSNAKAGVEDINCPSCKEKTQEDIAWSLKVKNSFKYAFGAFVGDIAVPFLVGVAIAALISVLIPDDFFLRYGINNSLVMMILMIIIGLPMYICSTSSIPIAIALIMKGISPGAAFVFLFVGPVTNIASIILLSKTWGLKPTVAYIVSVIIMSILFGLLLDFILNITNIQLGLVTHHNMHGAISFTMLAGAIIFTILLLYSIINRLIRKVNKSNAVQA